MTDDEIGRLYALLRVPSVSALPRHADDMLRAAHLVADEIRLAGGAADVRTSTARPLVVGDVPASTGAGVPRVIIYGHYDVQPVGDVALWHSDPFEPVVRDGNLYARGASDDKGNLFMLLVAVQRLAAEGRLPVNVTFLVDGEEEVSGTSALDWVRDEAPDAVASIIFDTAMAAPQYPVVCSGLRGLIYRRVRVRTAEGDAHSGIYGGAALNAAHALVQILEAIRPHDGRLHPDLYAGLAEATPDETRAWGTLPTGADLLAGQGLVRADPAAAREFYARTLAEPSLDVHALHCGEPDAVKTNLPSRASATLSVRLAPGQDHVAIGAALERIIHSAAPEGASVEVEELSHAEATLIDPATPALEATRDAIARSTGWPCVPLRVGGSIPVAATFAQRGIPPVLTGFGLPDDQIHAPNERLREAHLEIGAVAAMEILTALGGPA
ncbi:MAG: M20/M25/M40 family metallo-hydrolase [Thermoleophilia bacterium]|nr:M20/M25/M40 family metallo-hydrolase [Thermoleophilia bacterium]